MSAKQDRQGVRTAAQLEQKWKFGESFAEVMGVATNVRAAAEEAAAQARSLSKMMTPEKIFNILTNNGQLQGLYRGEDGELYINASYIKTGSFLADLIKTGTLSADLIKSGVLTSLDGTIKFDLLNNKITVHGNYGNKITISGGDIIISDSNETPRIRIGRVAESGYILNLYSTDQSSCVGFTLFDNAIQLRAKDFDNTDANTTVSHEVGWETINGVKTLVGK